MKKILNFILITAILSIIPQFNFVSPGFAYSPSFSKSKIITENSNENNNLSSQNNVDTIYSKNNKNNFTNNYTIPSVIKTPDEWKQALNYCIENVIESYQMTIQNFDENTYNLKNLRFIDTSVQANGTLKNNIAEITYTFTYKENYLLVKAAENSKYLSKLSDSQKTLLSKLKKISDDNIKVGMSDYEKEKVLHDYIVLNYSYSSSEDESSYTIRNLIEKGSGVCEAYAYAFQVLCTYAGLDCSIIVGNIENTNHGWNLIKLDGEYYHVDVTSDDPIPDKEGRLMYNFFNLTDEEISKTHTWNREDYPKCTATKYNYYVYNNLIITSYEQLEDFILKELDKGTEKIYFYLKGFALNSVNDFLFCRKSNRPVKNLSLIKGINSNAEDGAFTLIVNYEN